MVLKTYFDKNNTIILNSNLNTGKNPITEIFHGSTSDGTTYSRFLFQFDTTRLSDLVTNGCYPDVTKLTHTLKMTNTSCFDTDLLGTTTCGAKTRACSFNLILFRIEQDWDEGIGYDFDKCRANIGQRALSTCPSNWFVPTTGVVWSGGNGVFSGSSSAITITSQHFDAGNENIEMDITDEVNSILTGGTNNFGYGIAFSGTEETSETCDVESVGFFTRHTQTFFEPYVETTTSEIIQDDRGYFFLDKPNKLYLYTNLGGEPANLDNNPSVTILDHNGNTVSAFTTGDTVQVAKGVYCVELTIPTSNNAMDCLMYQDVWGDITINGISRPDVTLEFVLLDSGKYYNFGSDEGLPKSYGFSISGIKSDEKILQGDIRKIFVNARKPFTVNQKEIIDKLQYRLYVKEGNSEITVIDYQDVNRTFNHNYFLLDTASLIPQTYYLDVKLESNLQVSTIKDIIRFSVVNTPIIRK